MPIAVALFFVVKLELRLWALCYHSIYAAERLEVAGRQHSAARVEYPVSLAEQPAAKGFGKFQVNRYEFPKVPS